MSLQMRRPTGVIYGNQIWPTVAGYELVSSFYDEWYWQHFWMVNERPLIVQELMRFSSCGSPAIDVGTGTGFYLIELLRLNIECVGVDASQGMLKEARKKVPDSVPLICGTVEELPFPDKTFNLVIACRVFSHLENLDIAMRELGRITNIGCSLVFSDVSAYHNYTTTRIPTPDGDVHIETYKYTVDQLVEAGEKSGCWKLDRVKSVCYKDLLWKPHPSQYSSIDTSSVKPIFYYGSLTRIGRG
jgi:ubiquinone/menaquinone biosynthesis C-methylase UbiE